MWQIRKIYSRTFYNVYTKLELYYNIISALLKFKHLKMINIKK